MPLHQHNENDTGMGCWCYQCQKILTQGKLGLTTESVLSEHLHHHITPQEQTSYAPQFGLFVDSAHQTLAAASSSTADETQAQRSAVLLSWSLDLTASLIIIRR